MVRHVRPALNTPKYVLVAHTDYRYRDLGISALQGPARSATIEQAEFRFYPPMQLADSVTWT